MKKLILLMLIPAVSVWGESLFPPRITVQDQSFEKLGEYRYVYRVFFKLYDAALFTAEGGRAESVLEAESPFHLEFRYLRDIDKSIILKSADRMLEKNLKPEERAQIADRVARINQAYTSVKEGDVVSLTYEPGSGTTLRINGESITTIAGDDFAELYFRIWLGDQALSESLRENLLGRSRRK
jgi:hypothetical protein